MAPERRLLLAGSEVNASALPLRLSAAGARGLHLGHETCTRRMPSADVVRQAVETCSRQGWPFSLVTPAMAPETALARIESLLDLLPDACEVVANDWGVLRAVARRHPRLEPVLGRMLCGLRPDPRVPAIARELLGDGDAAELLADLAVPPVTTDAALRVLSGLRVRRIELNPVAQGLPRLPPPGVGVTLHLPWAVISATRYCPQQRMATPRPPMLVRACGQECAARPPVRIEHEQFPCPLYVADNALVVRAELPPDLPEWIDRVVVRELATG